MIAEVAAETDAETDVVATDAETEETAIITTMMKTLKIMSNTKKSLRPSFCIIRMRISNRKMMPKNRRKQTGGENSSDKLFVA